MAGDQPLQGDRWHPQMPIATSVALRPMIEQGFNIEVGAYTYGNPAVRWAPAQKDQYSLSIGRYCSIAADVEIYVGKQGRHSTDFLSTYPVGLIHGPMKPGDVSASHSGDLSVTIGNDVWIGRGALIMAGVTIGDGACIGTRSLVLSDVEPYTIVAGTPAKSIRKRFTDEQIASMVALQWWNLPDDVLKQNIDIFNKLDIDAVIDRLRHVRGH